MLAVAERPASSPLPTGRAEAAIADPEALFAKAVALHQAGDHAAAESVYRNLILLRPEHAEAWSNLSLLFMARGDAEAAVQACLTALALRPDYPEAHLNLIEALGLAGRHEVTVEVYRRAMALLPSRVDLPANLGATLEALGQPGEALAAFGAALALQPDHPVASLSAGRLLGQGGRGEEAVAVFHAALAARPDFVEALSNLGALLGSLGRLREAAEASARAFALRPDNAEIAGNFGVALQMAGRVAEAEGIYRHAIGLDPSRPGHHANRGVALQELQRFDEAVDAFAAAVALDPGFDTAVVEAIKVRRHICDWSRYEEDRATLLRLLAEGRGGIFMLLLMTFETSAAEQLACARLGMARLNAATAPRPAVPAPAADGRIRVGYLSHDFRDHPVGRLLPELLARHDRSRFAVTAYSLGKEDAGAVRARIRKGVERFVDLHPFSDRDAAARIAADGTDILVDLTGPTIGSRLPILAARPAPVQISLLGWPGTMGLDAIDYVIADHTLVGEGDRDGYAEKIIRLPDCYQPSDGGRGEATLPVRRQDCGLPDDAFVFCSFNNTSKITPHTFACWMRILRQVPSSVLWLYCKTPQTIAHLNDAAAAHGVDPGRLVFAGFTAMDLYLSRFRVADLFLDSLPYNAGATCNDALWAGLPVLTCVGDTYVGRMAASMLRTLGLPELVAPSLDAYEASAISWGLSPNGAAALKAKLAEAATTSPLFNMTRYASQLETAYATALQRASNGHAPSDFDVPSGE